jgi:hypothetical protein
MSTAFASATPRLPINLDWAIFDWNLPSWVFAAYAYLCKCGASSGQAWPSFQTIGNAAYPELANPESRRRKAIRAVAWLEQVGQISRLRRQRDDGGNRSNLYTLAGGSDRTSPQGVTGEHWGSDGESPRRSKTEDPKEGTLPPTPQLGEARAIGNSEQPDQARQPESNTLKPANSDVAQPGLTSLTDQASRLPQNREVLGQDTCSAAPPRAVEKRSRQGQQQVWERSPLNPEPLFVYWLLTGGGRGFVPAKETPQQTEAMIRGWLRNASKDPIKQAQARDAWQQFERHQARLQSQTSAATSPAIPAENAAAYQAMAPETPVVSAQEETKTEELPFPLQRLQRYLFTGRYWQAGRWLAKLPEDLVGAIAQLGLTLDEAVRGLSCS